MQRKSRHKMVAANPIAIALQVRDYHDTLINTGLATEYALRAVEDGTHTTTDLQRVAYMVQMTVALGHAGFVQEGTASADLASMGKEAMQSLNIGLLRHLSDVHQAQVDACTPTQYLRARAKL